MQIISRWCECGKGMTEGYLCCDGYYCSEDCLNASFEGTNLTWDEHYDDDGDCYYTDWSES